MQTAQGPAAEGHTAAVTSSQRMLGQRLRDADDGNTLREEDTPTVCLSARSRRSARHRWWLQSDPQPKGHCFLPHLPGSRVTCSGATALVQRRRAP